MSNRDWFSSFKKLNGCSVVLGDDRPYNMEGVCMVHIQIFDGMVRELKDVRYVPHLKMNIISIGTLQALSLEVSVKDGVLKITRGSMVILKDIRSNNLYYLKGSSVTGQVTTSTNSNDDYLLGNEEFQVNL